jgi:chromosome segregation ATPase
MANRVVGRSGGKQIAALVAQAGLVALMGSALVGCEEDDANATALTDASAYVRTISPGSVPPTDDTFATEGYRTASSKLAPAASGGTEAQKAIASVLAAEIEIGRARPAMTKLAEIEQQVGAKLTRMMSLETARVSAQQTAAALGGYDPSAERAAIDQQASALQQALSVAQAERQSLEQRVEGLGSQISSLEGQVRTIRAEESGLRDRALAEDPIAGAQTTLEARDTGRRADALEVQASTLDAQRSSLRPQIAALGVRIDAIDAQLAILSEARESVAQQARRSADEAAEAQDSAREFSAALVALATEIGALHQNEASAAVSEAREALDKAASTARRARSATVDGSLLAANASRSLGDLLARRAGSLEQTAGVFGNLAGRADGELGRRLSSLADEFAQRAQGLKQDAIESYSTAMSGFSQARAQGETREALQQAADDIERAIERLGGAVAGSDEPADEQLEAAPDAGVGETTGEMGG